MEIRRRAVQTRTKHGDNQMSDPNNPQNVFANAGYETRSYSGRAMYGAECLAVTIDTSIGKFFADVLESMDVEDGTSALEAAFRSMRTDSMGTGSVLYFPGTPYDPEL